jgi:predicted RNA binding protein YcfA (HicA-like mRNA interferase family)
MIKLPRITGRQVIAALSRAGFKVVRVRGSHHFLKHSDGRRTVIPVHSGEDMGPGLLNKILRDSEITKKEFVALLQ